MLIKQFLDLFNLMKKKVLTRYRVATLPENLEFENLGKKKTWKNLEFLTVFQFDTKNLS